MVEHMRSSERLGVVLSTITGGAPADFVALGQLAEAQGFAAVLVSEGRGDALACAQAIAAATTRVTVGTNIANIYLRHPFLAAATARAIALLSGGRFILGLGMSHRGLLANLGIDMGAARTQLREYVAYVRRALAGEGGTDLATLAPPLATVPLYVAGNTVESAAVAGEVGDGLMPYLTPREHLPVLIAAARDGAAHAGRDPAALRCILSMPVFVSDDLERARSAARYNLAFFARLPNYRRQWRRAGFRTAVAAAQAAWQTGSRQAAAAQIPDELLEQVCVFGPAARCRRALQAFRDAGVDLPVLAVSPVDEDRWVATRTALTALAPHAAET
jgi:alkanesulfonate monooxygenase SsuD/methylene tetrahydromethanopterin reductase-like flavin-dependent oxidoreductase (luciferase family)